MEFVCLSACSSVACSIVRLLVCLFVCLLGWFALFICLLVCLLVCAFVRLFVSLFVALFVCVSACLLACLLVSLSWGFLGTSPVLNTLIRGTGVCEKKDAQVTNASKRKSYPTPPISMLRCSTQRPGVRKKRRSLPKRPWALNPTLK